MRNIFFVLALVNLAYFAYAWFDTPAPPQPTLARTPPPPGTKPLTLLSETDAGKGDARDEISRAIQNPVRAGATANCLAVGPFSDIFSGQQVVDQLESFDVPAVLRAVDKSTGQNDYRVLLPPLPSLSEAFRKLRELKSRNIDSYVITEGKDALGISLGVFSTREAAEGARQQRGREGYETSIVEIPRLERAFWIFAREDRNLDLEPSLWDRLTSTNPGLQRQFVPCAVSG